MTDREAIIVLNMIEGIGYSKFNSLLDSFGNISECLEVGVHRLSQISGIGEKTAELINNWKNVIDLKTELSITERGGARIITIIDDDYPEQLKEIKDPPLCIYCKGNISTSFDNSIAIVGSRKMTMYGKEVTEMLASQLSYAGWTIISGLAYGVDAVAHQSVVNTKGRTIGVLGGGLTKFHPQDHLPLARLMIENNGGVISEFPMTYSPTKKSFPIRNRIISGLSRGVIVTEAGIQSGALITIDFALEQGRAVFAVPGRINTPSSSGCNKLIKNGAKLVESIEDIFEDFEFLPGLEIASREVQNQSTNNDLPKIALSDKEKKIIGSIANEEKGIDQILSETQIAIGELLSLLNQLEMKRVIKQIPGKVYKINT